MLCVCLLATSCANNQVAVSGRPEQLSNPSPSLAAHPAAADSSAVDVQPVAAPHPRRANFELEHTSEKTRHMADWVVDSGDNRGMPFVIVDKIDARVFVFDADGRLLGAAPALLGLARGDETSPGIGDRKLSEIRPQDRITQAGRFVASLGVDVHGKDVLWVDYDSALSLHRVVTNNPKERRLQRLASSKPLDHRISWGCINVSVNFYNDVVTPAFTGTCGIVYVMPETKSIDKIFESYYDIQSCEGTDTTANLNEGTRKSRGTH